MHRELTHVDEAFRPPRVASLYLLTGLLLALVLRDLWPQLAVWLNGLGADLPSSSNRLFGMRYALIAAIIGGGRVLYSSLEALAEGRLGADLALAIACIAAILVGEPLVAAEVVLIGLIGECLESFTFSRTQNAIRKLAELFPHRCWLLRDGQEVRVEVASVQVGDLVVVKPGAKVPVDGIIRDGRSAVDVSALTGESLPLDKGMGDEVLAGSINQFGALTVEAKQVREHTVAGRVIAMTSQALKEKAPVVRQADRLARWFLPAVLGLALLTFIGNLLWYMGPFRPETVRLGIGAAARISIYPTLAVLVVACPCALILATPAAMIAALGRLAGTGVLLKSGAALEKLAGVTSIAFDKTGTLTEGRLELGDILLLDRSTTADELLRAAATAEQRSEHPIAQLILQAAAARSLPLDTIDDFISQPSAGVRAQAGSRTILVGTRRWLQEHDLEVTPEAEALLTQLDAEGQTPLLIAADGRILGVVGARDRIRPEANGVLVELRQMGLADMSLLTGDRAAVAKRVAAELGIDTVHAELLPHEKAEIVARGRQTAATSATSEFDAGNPSNLPQIAFVGDGINDAPALARATVGIAVGTGTDIAAEAGDVVLMREPLRPLPLLIRLSRRTVEIIHQNIVVFAFGVNLVGIVVTGWLWPLFARSPEWYERAPLAGVIYHQVGSLLVLLNSMRLLTFERKGIATSSARFQGWLQRLDGWIERLTDVDGMLHELSHRWRPIAAAAAMLLVVAVAISGMTQVAADEVAVVRRFGKPLAEDLGPGLHWRWPWPIEKVDRIQPNHARTVEVGYRVLRDSTTNAASIRPASTWSSAHEGEGLVRIAEEAQAPTGDGNLVELQAVLQFRINSPRRYLLEVKDPDEILRSNLEAILREGIAGEAFLDLLTARREAFQRETLGRLKKRLESYGEPGLGITLEGLSLRDLHPPPQVVPDFHAVAQAAEDHDRRVKVAEADALRLRRQAESDALDSTRKAESDAVRTVKTAAAERDVFLAWYQVRNELSPACQALLASDLVADIAAGKPVAVAIADYERRRQRMLEDQAFLVDFRLTWGVLGQTLGSRDKVFIDADKLPGRRTLFLIGPDQLTPPPIIMPNRSSGRDSR
jgi:Cu+-exporting ATPase